MSKAQASYAEQIVKYFDKHPDAGVDLTVEEVLADMDVWTSRHRVHKNGGTWLDDAARAAVEAEIMRLKAGIEPLRIAAQRAGDYLRLHGRTIDETARETARQEARDTRVAYAEAGRAAAAAVRGLAERYGDQHHDEIAEIATRKGVLR